MTIARGAPDPAEEAERAERDSQIVKLRIEGVAVSEIAKRLSVDDRTVYRVIKTHADGVRDRTGDLCEEMFALHQARLDDLWLRAQKRLDDLPPEASNAEFAHAVRAAIAILERQSRLLGLDRERLAGGANKHDWLDKASEAELREAAVRWGLTVPEKFSVA